jgi:hypothetical protein
MMKRLWHQFAVEVVALALFGLGAFLIFERMQIRASILRFVARLLRMLDGVVDYLAQGLSDAVNRVAFSDVTGGIVIAVAVWLIVGRARWRVAHCENLAPLACPACGSRLHRVHRRTHDRLFTWIVPLRRYRCANRSCRWTGLRSRSNMADQV